MEEVWKDISLGTPHREAPPTPGLSFNLYSADPTANAFRGVILQDFLAGVFKDATPVPASPVPNSGGGVACLSVSAWSGSPAKRSQEPRPATGAAGRSGIDRRKKRMLKNRESAARSRARKQAYTHELEVEVNRLAKENKVLKRQHEELLVEMALQNRLVSNRTLQRTLTAPF